METGPNMHGSNTINVHVSLTGYQILHVLTLVLVGHTSMRLGLLIRVERDFHNRDIPRYQTKNKDVK